MQVFDDRAGGEQALTLSQALLIYTRPQAGLSQIAGHPLFAAEPYSQALVSLHDVTVGEIGPGRLLDSGTYSDLIRRVGGLEKGGKLAARQITPPNVLYAGGDRLFWYAPSVRRPIWFKTGHKRFDAEMNGQVVTHPPLLFLASPGHLHVWALGEDTRPSMDTPLFLAPYYNLYTHGAMCAGNVALPKTLTERDITNWETYFYDTEFTHSNYHGAAVTQRAGGHDKLWRALRFRQEWRGFPKAWLTPAPTVGEAHLTAGESATTQLSAGEALNL